MKKWYDDMPLFSESISTNDLSSSDENVLQVERNIPIEISPEDKRKDKIL